MRETKGKIIFHIDMNSFYASVEAAHHPELRGKALAIAGRAEERRGIVVTSSYEARAKGVRTTMTVWQAREKCPELIVRTPDFPLYRETSKKIFEMLSEYTDLIQKASIDEGYLDMSDVRGIHPVKLAKKIQQRIYQTLRVPCSIGIAPNKFLAKMASDMKKPMGITVLRKRTLANQLWPLEVGEMHGVGPKSAEKLNALNVKTIGDLARMDPQKLKQHFGVYGEKMHKRANGNDDRPVDPDAYESFKSIGQSTTLPRNLLTREEAEPIFKRLSEKGARRMREKKVVAYRLAIQIRYSDWRNVTRARTLFDPVHTEDELLKLALDLFDEHWDGEPVRLLGLTASELVEKQAAVKQLDLFSLEAELAREPLINTMEKIRDKYGEKSIGQGDHYLSPKKYEKAENYGKVGSRDIKRGQNDDKHSREIESEYQQSADRKR